MRLERLAVSGEDGTVHLSRLFSSIQTNDLVVRREDNDQLLIEDNRHLSEYNVVDGTEIAFFKRSDYELYLKNPVLAMD